MESAVHHALIIIRYNSVTCSNALICCKRYRWVAAYFLAGKTDVSNSNFQQFCDNLIRKSEICVAWSLFEALMCSGRGALSP